MGKLARYPFNEHSDELGVGSESGSLVTSNNWKRLPLEDVLNFVRNGSSAKQNREGVGYPVTRIETISRDRIDPERVGYVADLTEAEIEKHRLSVGDILFSHINSEPQIGRSVLYRGNPPFLIHGMNLLRLSPNGAICLPEFLDYQLRHLRRQGVFVALAARAVGQSSINQGKLKRVEIALPSMQEQDAIAYILRTVQEATEAAESVIASTRELKKSLMHHVFTYGPVPVADAGEVPLKETEIGLVPEHWDVRLIGEVCDLSTGTTPSTKEAHYYDGDVPFIKTSEIANNVIRHAQTHVSDEAVNDYRLKIYPPGTVFLAMYGQGKTRGQVGILDVAAATTQNTAAIAPRDGLDSRFLWFYLMSRYNMLRGEGVQGHISHLNLGFVKNLPVPVPSMAIQRQVVSALAAVEHKISIEVQRSTALAALFQSLLHDLMTGKVRVTDLDTAVVAAGGG